MAIYLPWITFFIGILAGWLLTWLMLTGGKRDLEQTVSQLEEELAGREADLADCKEDAKNKAAELKTQIKSLKSELKESKSELKSVSADLEACAGELEALQHGAQEAAAAVVEAQQAKSVTEMESPLTGKWMVEYITDRPVIDNSPASLEFGEKGALSGNASCNNYFGTYQAEGSSLTLNAAGKSNKMCVVEALMEQEARFMEALPNVASFEIVEGILLLSDADGETVFRAAQHA